MQSRGIRTVSLKSIRYAPGLSGILLAVNGRIDGLAAWRFVLKSTVAADVQIEIGRVSGRHRGLLLVDGLLQLVD
jgi:hypothetical protein